MQGILPLTPLGALPQTPHSPCGRGISYCFFPLGKCYAPLRQGRVVFSPAEKISTLCLDCVLALSALKNLFRRLFIEQPTELSDHLFSCVLSSSMSALWTAILRYALMMSLNAELLFPPLVDGRLAQSCLSDTVGFPAIWVCFSPFFDNFRHFWSTATRNRFSHTAFYLSNTPCQL